MNVKTFLQEHKEEFAPWLVNNEQGRIDIKILPYLENIEGGFFVEAGALDGLFMSNTKILEDLGWQGVLIEPSQLACIECFKNRKVPIVWGALVSNNFKGDTIFGDFFYDGAEGLGAWSSVNRNQYALKEKVSAPAVTLTQVLKALNVKKVDFLSLDVEGYELKVLRGLDLSEFEVSYILVEVNNHDYDLEDIEEYLGKYGYKNLGCLSNFSKETNEGWDGSHQDYLWHKT